MKNTTIKNVALLVAAGVAVGAGVWYIVFDESAEAPRADESFRSVVSKDDAKKPKDRPAKGLRIRKDQKGIRAVPEKLRPDLKLEADDEAKLTAQMLEIYRALQDALDKDDSKRVFSLVHRLQGMDEWPDGIPMAVKKRALSALAWFGAPGIAEAIGFLADSNPEIRSDAVETFEKQLADNWDLGVYKLADTLIAMAKVVNDADALDTFYDQFDNMRPSVRASTVAEIYKSGTEDAKKVLDQKLESIFATDDTTVQTREDVDKALKAAQEEEKDTEKKKEYDDMYGPANWDW